MREHKNMVPWKLGSKNGETREDEVAVLVVVAAMAMVVADKDNVGISLTAVLGLVVVTPLARNEEVNPRTTGIFIRAEPTNFAVPQPSFGRSC